MDHLEQVENPQAANHFSTAFLLATLKWDADATFTPEAVAFAGVTGQASGFQVKQAGRASLQRIARPWCTPRPTERAMLKIQDTL